MRFYEIAFFMIFLNLMTIVVNQIPIFPDGSVDTRNTNSGVLNSINNFTASFKLPALDNSITGFTSFIWLPWMAINFLAVLYQLVLQISLGFPILIGSFFGCSGVFPFFTGCYPTGIEYFIYVLSGVVALIYVIAIIQFIRGQNIERY